MNPFKILIATVFFASIASMLFGQKIFREGYVVKNNTDTLNGLVQFEERQKPSQVIIFKRFDIALPVLYTSESIMAYGYKNGNHYERKNVSGEQLFLECYVKGKISLYGFGSKLYIEKNDRNFTELKASEFSVYTQDGQNNYANFKEFLSELTKDSEGFQIPEKLTLKAELLIPLITNYNSHSGSPFTIYDRKFDRNIFDEATMLTGINRSNYGAIGCLDQKNMLIKSSTRNFNPFPDLMINKYNIAIGGFYSYQISRINKNYSLRIEGLFTNTNNNYYIELIRQYPNETHRVDLSLKRVHITIPITLQYFRTYNKYSPYINVGLCYNLDFDYGTDGLLDVENNQNEVYTYSYKPSSFTNGLLNKKYSSVIGIGLKYRVSSSYCIFIETRLTGRASYQSFEFNYYYAPEFNLRMSSPISFLLGIAF